LEWLPEKYRSNWDQVVEDVLRVAVDTIINDDIDDATVQERFQVVKDACQSNRAPAYIVILESISRTHFNENCFINYRFPSLIAKKFQTANNKIGKLAWNRANLGSKLAVIPVIHANEGRLYCFLSFNFNC
jgi:hypothetical protein